MYVYHLDRAHSLKEGQILDLVPLKHKEIYDLKTLDFLNPLPNNLLVSGFSAVSLFMSNMCKIPFPNHSCGIEDKAERIRRVLFKEKPSRVTSMFGVLQISDLDKWRKVFDETKSPYDNRKIPIWKIECESCSQEFDASFLRGRYYDWNHDEIESLINYWKGIKSFDFLPEVLIPLPAKVISLAGYF
jgi:hypothetical protein